MKFMKKKKQQKPWKEETEKLMNFIYENELENDFQQFSPYHFRILGNLDVWAGSKKYYVHNSGGSCFYENVDELKEVIDFHAKPILTSKSE